MSGHIKPSQMRNTCNIKRWKYCQHNVSKVQTPWCEVETREAILLRLMIICTIIHLVVEDCISYRPRSTAIASISSKNTIEGAALLAFLKTSLTAFSDSPTHLLNNSGPCGNNAIRIEHINNKYEYYRTMNGWMLWCIPGLSASEFPTNHADIGCLTNKV